ncbi:MAG: hypothetical protein OMM_13419, partial [Candidatus Magnetoglobus multicellularis str. Araruama]
DEVLFIVSPVNDPPVVSDISDQSISEGKSFTAIQLDDFVDDIDNADNEITWTAIGQSNLTVTISNRIATIETKDSEWNGSETILFIAADPDGLTASDEVIFTVTEVNDPPVVSGIADQSISEGESFTAIQLDNFVTDVDNLTSELIWTAKGQSELTVAITNRSASITSPANWHGSESILFIAADPDGLTGFEAVNFTVIPVNGEPVISNIPNQNINEGDQFTSIELDDYVLDYDNADDEMSWTTIGQSDLSITITNRIAVVTIPDQNWNGSESITFIVADPEGLTSSDEVTFTVSPINDPPVVSGITDQSISEGNSFTAIQLDNFVDDIDNADNEITWTASGQSNLTVTISNRIATIEIKDSEWNGSETILFIAADPDGLTSSDEVLFIVSPVNDPPVVSDISDQSISEGKSFTAIQLDDFVDDIDNADNEI